MNTKKIVAAMSFALLLPMMSCSADDSKPEKEPEQPVTEIVALSLSDKQATNETKAL